MHELFLELFRTVFLRPEFSIFTLQEHVCCGYRCDAGFLLFYFFSRTLRFSWAIIKSLGKGVFLVLRCKKTLVLVVTQLNTGRGKSLLGAVRRDKSRRDRNVLWGDLLVEEKRARASEEGR